MINLIDSNADRPVKNNLAKFSEAELEYWYEQKRKARREGAAVLDPLDPFNHMGNADPAAYERYWADNKRSCPQASARSRIREDFRDDPSAVGENSRQEAERDQGGNESRSNQRGSKQQSAEDVEIERLELCEQLDARRYDHANPPPRPEPIFTLNGQSIATPGNIVVIQSKAKGGKSGSRCLSFGVSAPSVESIADLCSLLFATRVANIPTQL